LEEYTTVPAVLRVKHNRIKAARESGTEDRLAVFCNQRLRRHAAAPAACQPITAQPVAALLLWWRRGGVAALAQTFRPAQQPRVLVNALPVAALLAFWAAGSRRRHLLVRAAAEVAVTGNQEVGATVKAAAVAAHALRLSTALLLVHVAHAACLRGADGVLGEGAAVHALPAAACLSVTAHALCLAARLWGRRGWGLVAASTENVGARH